MAGAQFEIRIDHTPHLSRSEGLCDGGGVISEIPKSAQRCRSQGPKEWRGDGRHLQGRLMPLTMHPAALVLGSTRTARTTPCSAVIILLFDPRVQAPSTVVCPIDYAAVVNR
jgi:hypothetical protein